MKSLIPIVFLLSIGILMASAMDHYEKDGCMCQEGGEAGGHCHCPDGHPMPGVPCEKRGSNHLICFPHKG